jgi:voltage-gated potassium channel
MKRITVIVALLLVLSSAGTVGIHWLTGRTWLESAYLAVITLTTVGSEDVPNKDPWAMLFIMGYLICGLGIFSYSAFQIGAAVVDLQLRRILEKRRMEKSIDALHNHFVICGLGRMGTTMCAHLAARKQPFVVIDRDELRLQHVAHERGWMCLHGDATDD